MMKVGSRKVIVSKVLLERVCKLLGEKRQGTIIIRAFVFFLSDFYNECSPLYYQNTGQSPEDAYASAYNKLCGKPWIKRNINKFKRQVAVSVNIPYNIDQLLKIIVLTNDRSKIANLCLMFVISHYKSSNELTIPAIKLHGNKFKPIMRDTIRALVRDNKYERITDVFAGALGISTRVQKYGDKLYVNVYDDVAAKIDMQKTQGIDEAQSMPQKGLYNLIEVVKNQPFGLITNILTLDVSEDTFTKIKELYESNNNNKDDSSLAYATYYFYLNALSVRNKMGNFNSSAKNKMTDFNSSEKRGTLLNAARHIYEYSLFLNQKNTYLKSNNYKELIGVRRRAFSENSLVIYDPPYIDCEDYNTGFTLEDHKNLIKTVVNSKADFIYFIRPRVKRTVGKVKIKDKDTDTDMDIDTDIDADIDTDTREKEELINISPQKLKADDIILQNKLRELFKNKGKKGKLYYILIPYKRAKFPNNENEIVDREFGVTYELIVTSIKPNDDRFNELKNKHWDDWDNEGYWEGFKREIKWDSSDKPKKGSESLN